MIDKNAIKELLEYVEQKNIYIYIPCKSTMHMNGLAATPLNFIQHNALKDALNKQIPLKPTKENDCSICNYHLFGFPHCVKCGQKIDWDGTLAEEL